LKNAFDGVSLQDTTPKKTFDSKNVPVKSAFKFSKGQIDVQVFEVVDEFEEQLR